MFEANNNNYDNNNGVTIEAPGYGETETVEFINTDNTIEIPYMNDFVDYFVARGYERGKSIRAAPYDWRLAAG